MSERHVSVQPMRARTALLPNGNSRWTRHKFVGERAVLTQAGHVTGYEQIFRCTETGVERRWGMTSQRLEHEV